MNERKINFKVDYDKVIMDLNDFKWLCTQLYYNSHAVGCIPNMHAIRNAEKVLNIMQDNNLTRYVD